MQLKTIQKFLLHPDIYTYIYIRIVFNDVYDCICMYVNKNIYIYISPPAR